MRYAQVCTDEADVVRPVNRTYRSPLMGITIAYTWAIWSDQAKAERGGEFVVECGDIPRHAHADAADDRVAAGISNFGEGDAALFAFDHDGLG